MNNKNISIAVIGLGYVGLPLAIKFSCKYETIGFDKDLVRLSQLKKSIDKTMEVDSKDLDSSKIVYTSNIKDISDCNIYIVTVPTPVDKNKNPDLSPLLSATKIVGDVLDIGDVVIYESTVYPGATEEYCVPVLIERSNLKYNKDFFCGYSPERINPGDREHTLTSITKITSGSNIEAAQFVDNLYKSIITKGTYMASSIAVAEAAKVIENIQRDVNIALINELSMVFEKLSLDTNEILEAAGTKWNFLPFRPGLVGGHCIGVDPYYLTYKAQEIGYNPEIILAGRRINDSMGKYIANHTIINLGKMGINPVGAKIAILGLTFKENCPDLRNTKVPDIINYLKAFKCDLIIEDPYADQGEAKKLYNITLSTFSDVCNCDAVIIPVAHKNYSEINIKKWINIFNSKGVLIDVKSIYSTDYFNNASILHWRL